MIAAHTVEEIRFTIGSMFLKIDGKEVEFPLAAISSKLMAASDVERNLYKISPSGYGIHWPLIDEDLSIDALLRMR